MSSHIHLARPLPAVGGRAFVRGLLLPPARWLHDDARRAGDQWILTLRAGRLVRQVRARIGSARMIGDVVSRKLSWHHVVADDLVPGWAVPDFVGRFEASDPGDGVPGALVLAGRYTPPGGVVGKGVDALIMRSVARHTLTEMLNNVYEGLERNATDHEERQERMLHVHR